MDDKIFISWSEFHKDVRLLADKIMKTGRYNKIIAISRGGLVPAGLLAYMLDIRNTAVVNVSSYFGDKQLKIEKINDWEKAGKIDNQTLVVDDLVDTGQTFSSLKKIFSEATFACVFAKPCGRAVADVYAKEVPDKWVVFPWDEI